MITPAETLLLDGRKENVDRVVSLRTRTITVVLDRLGDSFNMAAVLRTCEAHGIQEVHVVEHPTVKFSPHPQVTQGCDKWLDVYRHQTFDDCHRYLKTRGFLIWASALGEAATSLFDLHFNLPVALVFGNERNGCSPDVLAKVDARFWIPMRGFTQSFNVSVAVASTLTHALGWRAQHLGPAGDLSPLEADVLREKFYKLSLKQRGRIYGKKS